jgi:hypothetical protein
MWVARIRLAGQVRPALEFAAQGLRRAFARLADEGRSAKGSHSIPTCLAITSLCRFWRQISLATPTRRRRRTLIVGRMQKYGLFWEYPNGGPELVHSC